MRAAKGLFSLQRYFCFKETLQHTPHVEWHLLRRTAIFSSSWTKVLFSNLPSEPVKSQKSCGKSRREMVIGGGERARRFERSSSDLERLAGRRRSRRVGEMLSWGEIMDQAFMHSSCVFSPSWRSAGGSFQCTSHLICPAGTNAPRSHCVAPWEPHSMLLFSSILNLYFGMHDRYLIKNTFGNRPLGSCCEFNWWGKEEEAGKERRRVGGNEGGLYPGWGAPSGERRTFQLRSGFPQRERHLLFPRGTSVNPKHFQWNVRHQTEAEGLWGSS